jgi:hypothetical protein
VIPRRAWLLPGRRQALLLAALILVGGASLLLLPENSRSYRAVAIAMAPTDAADCIQAAPDHVVDESVQDRVAFRARVDDADVARSTEVLPTPAAAVLAVAFEADTAYAAQRGASTTFSDGVVSSCNEGPPRRLTAEATTAQQLTDAEAALRVAPLPTPALVAARDQAAADALAAAKAYDQQSTLPERSTSVAAAEPLGSRRSGSEEQAVPAGVALCVVLALAVLRVGWRRAAAPVPA